MGVEEFAPVVDYEVGDNVRVFPVLLKTLLE
jgi:hypothetical protein